MNMLISDGHVNNCLFKPMDVNISMKLKLRS